MVLYSNKAKDGYHLNC